MDAIEFTIKILEYYQNKDVRIEKFLDVNNGNLCLQIDLNRKYVKQFAFFYYLTDDVINYSFIMEKNDSFYQNAEEIKEEFKDIFQSLIKEDDSSTLHLYSEVNINKFDEKLLDRIYEFVSIEPFKLAN